MIHWWRHKPRPKQYWTMTCQVRDYGGADPYYQVLFDRGWCPALSVDHVNGWRRLRCIDIEAYTEWQAWWLFEGAMHEAMKLGTSPSSLGRIMVSDV